MSCIANTSPGKVRGSTHEPCWEHRSLVGRWVRLIAGLWLFAFGLATMVGTGLGLSSWDVLHDALRAITPLSFGQVILTLSIVVVVVGVSLGIRPGPGTIANALLIGLFTDVLLKVPVFDAVGQAHLAARLGSLAVGIWAIALGSAVYIGADLGSGPRDALMLGVAKKSSTTPGRARSAIEAAVLVTGVLLGGSVGPGTILFAVTIGPAIDVSFRALHMQPPFEGARFATIARSAHAVGRWGRRGQLGSGSKVGSRYTGGRV